MYNRMDENLKSMMAKGEKILITYYPICDPVLGDPVEAAGKYLKAGATVLEMGLPYENPSLDGKVVRETMERALKEHSVNDAFAAVKACRKAYPNANLQIMTYYEIIDSMGMKEFAKKCFENGADAVLTPNIPADKVKALDEALNEKGLIQLRFAPYTLNDAEIKDLKENAHGYIFQQAVNGATGMQEKTDPQVGRNVKILKENGIQTPVCAGFGISNAKQTKEMKDMGADGIICGSAVCVAAIDGKLEEFIRSLRAALD